MSGTLRLGMLGPEVKDLQNRLNCSPGSRLPRLDPDGIYGVLTKARVMEFQRLHHLLDDGVAGPITLERLSRVRADCRDHPARLGRCILVDLINRRLTAFENGISRTPIHPIAGGRPTAPSDPGVFSMTERRLRHHTSSQFPAPAGQRNMDYAMFYHGGEAIHQGNPNALSHGCIHVGAPHAEQLFNWVGSSDVRVIVVTGEVVRVRRPRP